MTLLAITQRVVCATEYIERRDALDQRWAAFLKECGHTPLVLPNHPEVALQLVKTMPVGGLILTGGNNLVTLGGDAPERDQTEEALIQFFMTVSLPILGVCRGMQLLQQREGVSLQTVEGHVAVNHSVRVEGEERTVNSYHTIGARETTDNLMVEARAEDGVIEAIRHRHAKIYGMMWHPERETPFTDSDIAFFQTFFGGSS